MIKVLILTMILVSSGYLGLSISNVYKTKLNFFKELSSYTKNIKNEISFTKTDTLTMIKKYQSNTTFGKFLDPIADKLLVLSALIMLVEQGIIPGWIPIIIAAREFIVSGIRMLAAGDGKVIAASWYGKVKTVSQMVAISLAFLSTNTFMQFTSVEMGTGTLILNILMSLAMIVAVLMTILSGVDYFMKSKDIVLKSK